jgi:hypothetical protein
MSKFIGAIVIAVIPVVIGVIGTITVPAVGSPSCMTQEEARKAFPRDHIYWHGPQHCWDNKHRSQKPAADANPSGSPAKSSEIDKPGKLVVNKPSEPAVDRPSKPIIVPPVRFISDDLRRGLSWPVLNISTDDVPARAQQDDPLPPTPPPAPKEDVVIGAPNAAPGSPGYLLEHCCWPPSVPDGAREHDLLPRMVIASTSACMFAIGLWLFVYRRRQPVRRRAAVRVRARNNFSGSRIPRSIAATVSLVARQPRRSGT